mmetsp:Transcript_8715/g.9923  ORF Transcript_8715/g.9923 Transcript_8715/m.9923 type:complete len:157 (-) Transcript_8715:1119-1589(-)|eukprot:CAMPEP_0204858978 /NCGR_PEP_ID=MMETSP1347-20130617/23413_1 /ASSEMBLY_ACC=CAM_ASM_000690 /TAXON_ID=215587 /ORGANISM="Aplanochytrium stocchinoi, Strain GSBS06" /LENGTH=156 /DNA_ID=CAMNT_0052007345 /DNA_START=95 /DNA_END=565 /DNA_ORIENTATION=+
MVKDSSKIEDDKGAGVKIVEAAAQKLNKPRSTPASGRWWKPVQCTKTSLGRLGYTNSRRKAVSKSWARKMEDRRRRQEIKDLEEDLKKMKQKQVEEEKQRLLEKRKRKAEAELKNTTFQMIKNPAKLKKMSKKQLKMIKKTTVDKEGNIRLVGAYQ